MRNGAFLTSGGRRDGKLDSVVSGLMTYPGHVVKPGEGDPSVVRAIVARLSVLGYAAGSPDGVFDQTLAALVKEFQSQHVDAAGRPLKADGAVGPLTWSALFGVEESPQVATGLAGAALAVATSQVGVMEEPPGSNSGPKVKAYLASVGLGPGQSWCMAFVHWCFEQASSELGIADPFPRTAGCLDAWARVNASASARVLTAAQARANPGAVKAGMVFILDHGAGHGHTGFVSRVTGGALSTVEGNSNNGGSAEGVGVFALNRRSVMEADLKGFIDFNH